MSQAEELLNSLTEDEIAAYSVDPDSEPHIVVGSDRFIIVPESLKRIAVQYDHDIETVPFDCPRYWDEHDLSTMAIYINYMRSDKYTDSYPVSDISVDGDIMHFSWTISRNVTEVNGPISFLVCAKNTDEDGNEINHWNTELCQDMYVSEGMETDEQPMDTHPDIITQLLLRMDDVEKVAVTKSEIDAAVEQVQNIVSYAGDAYHDTVEVKNEVIASVGGLRNSYANAIKKTKSGAIVTADDVSPVEHDVKCWAHGKNLVNVNDVTITNYTGYHKPIPLGFQITAGVTYTLSMDIESTTEPFIVSVGYGDKVSYFIDGTYSRNISNGRIEITFTPTEDLLTKGSYLHIRAPRYATETTYSANVSNIQLELGNVATEYEPYIDPTTVMITGCGKNLIYKPYSSGSSYTINGVTFTEQNDGSVIVNGTPTGAGEYLFKRALKLPPGRYSYRLFGVEQIASLCSGVINQYDGETWKKGFGTDKGEGLTFEITEEDSQYLFRANIYVYATTGGTVNNVRLYPMLCAGDVPTKFEQVLGATYVPDSNGECTVKSVSPNMTIFTNNPGVTVEAEYSQDLMDSIDETVDYAIQNQSPIGYTVKHLYLDSPADKKCTITIPSSNTEVKLWRSGKNMLPKFAERTIAGITVTVDTDGTITLNGTLQYGTGATASIVLASASFDSIPYDRSKIYWTSMWNYTPAPHTAGNIVFRVKNQSGSALCSTSFLPGDTNYYHTEKQVASYAKTTESLSTAEIYLYNVPNGTVFDNWKFKVQLEQTDYSDYATSSGEYSTPSLEMRTLPVKNGEAIQELSYIRGGDYFTTNEKSLQFSTTTQVPTQSWLGKRWAAFGDSITFKAPDSDEIRYHDVVAKELGLSVLNYGKATTGYATTGSTSEGHFYTRMQKIAPDGFDFMTIMGSCNDFGVINRGEKPLGTYTDTGTDTVCGCINTTIDTFYELAPLKRLGVITMLPTYSYGPDLITTAPNAENYVNAVVQICKNRGIPCLDLYHCSGLRPWIPEVKSALFRDGDGIHPNDEGSKFIAPLIREFVKSLI